MLGFRRWSNKKTTPKLVIYDDLFPYKVSGFRLAELESYLKLDSRIEICTTLASLGWLRVDQTKFEVVKEWKKTSGKDFARQIKVIDTVSEIPKTSAIYSIFLNNIYSVIDEIEFRGIKFAFTLYPGGGFALFDDESDRKLDRVIKSPQLYRVIVTQPVTLDYLADRFPYVVDKVAYVFGGVHPTSENEKIHEFTDELEIVFVANKYHPQGLDKGFDLYVNAMNRLAQAEICLNSNIVGPWGLEDIPQNLRFVNHIFHGAVGSTELQKLLSNFDVGIFPTRSNELGRGTFDGFPTGSAIEAGLAGCLVLTTNPLGQLSPLIADKDYFEIDESVDSIIERVMFIASHREQMMEFRKDATSAFSNFFSLSSQMKPRIAVINALIEDSTFSQ